MDQYLLDIIQQHSFSDQNQILKILRAKGYQVTQSTLSRKFKKLNIVKKEGIYQYQKASPLETRRPWIEICPPNLVILKTLPGHGQALAYQLEALELKSLMATVAGDDTIFAAVHPAYEVEALFESLKKHFKF